MTGEYVVALIQLLGDALDSLTEAELAELREWLVGVTAGFEVKCWDRDADRPEGWA